MPADGIRPKGEHHAERSKSQTEHPPGFSTGSNNAKEATPRRVPRLLGVLRQLLPEGNAGGGSPRLRAGACFFSVNVV